jgi:hypothetical protein
MPESGTELRGITISWPHIPGSTVFVVHQACEATYREQAGANVFGDMVLSEDSEPATESYCHWCRNDPPDPQGGIEIRRPAPDEPDADDDWCDCESCEELRQEQRGREREYRRVRVDWTPVHEPHPLAMSPRLAGVEIEVEGSTENPDIPEDCGITEDGSLDPDEGMEVQTPPRSGKALVDMIETTCRGIRNAGYYATEACGLHVHLDMRGREHDGAYLGRLFAMFYAVEGMLYDMVDGERRYSEYCTPLSDAWETAGEHARKGATRFLGDWHGVIRDHYRDRREYAYAVRRNGQEHYHPSRYYGVNFHAVPSNGTLEIRIHHGTTDPTAILNWIALIQSVMDTADKRFPTYAKCERLAQTYAPTYAWVNEVADILRLTDEVRQDINRRMAIPIQPAKKQRRSSRKTEVTA